ncbi:MAG: N-acetylmuramidase domain-containing protein [Anaerolineae bacterium]|jgi:hypothetical protein
MSTRTCRVGVHGRNQEIFHDTDYRVIRDAKAEVVKMMSQTKPEVFERIKRENPHVEFITRLYDDRMNTGGHPTPREFADKMIPLMRALKPYCTKFQIHNEPNHHDRIEGWGPTKADAEDFNKWFLQAYKLLKEACPWASLGFPGLAIPNHLHKDRVWLDACREAIKRADWLGVHCYWQTPQPGQKGQMRDDRLGRAYQYYHNKFPNKTLEILECGNSNIHTAGYHTSEEAIAQEYVEWLQELFKHDYINSASFFILSSQDPQWGFFSWRTEHNHIKPVVPWVAQMHRPPLTAVREKKKPAPRKPPKEPPAPSPQKPPTPPPAPGQWTNQQMITALHNASVKLGLKPWALMGRAGIKLADLVKDRGAPYQGPGIDQLPRLTDEQRDLVKEELVAIVGPEAEVEFGLVEELIALRNRTDLVSVSLALPWSERIDPARVKTSLEKRVARTWNRYSYLLLNVADVLMLDPGVVTAVLAAQTDRRGFNRQGRLNIRFENHIFYDRWGKQNEELFAQHFKFDPAQPWQSHQWRPSADKEWRDCHGTQDMEWQAFEFARSLDEDAAFLSTAMGLARMMGFNHTSIDYESAGQMFDAFNSGERYQIFAVFDFIAGPDGSSRQLAALRRKDFDVFASLHYGSKQAARYGGLIRGLYEAFQGLHVL